ncbi:MAG: hypothetical protein H0T72_08370 [Chloroflexia bacterium]|nr:hypothetical protein [Chloroflexia bacterium]
MTEASRYLIAIAADVAAAYVDTTGPRAVLLTGSAAEGVSDYHSDLDLIAYYDRLPIEDQLEAARDSLQAIDVRVSPGREALLEEYALRGIECQVAHITIFSWERNMASVLEECTPATNAQKAINGLLDGHSLHGDDLIQGWKDRAAAYPDGLAMATVEHYLQFFPLWLAAERWDARDATIFYHQMLVDSSLNLLGVLAGLNRLYFSTFQFKRLDRFVSEMHSKPARLAVHLNSLFALDPVDAGAELERLVDETLTLVETHMPIVNTKPSRRHVGKRHDPWTRTARPPSTEL